ncbi:MAG: hypothetical protein QXR81_07740 [Candidatus Nezhaarchaeales archaeon]
MVGGSYGLELISGCNKPSECYERMDDHLRGIKLVYDNFFSHYNNYVSTRVKRGGHRDSCAQSPYVVLAFHDAGKAIYQDSLRSRCTAPLHEIASAAIALRICDGILCERCMATVTLSILLHHHVMRPPNVLASELRREGYLEEFRRRVQAGGAYIDRYIEMAARIFGFQQRFRSGGLREYLKGLEGVKNVLNRFIELSRASIKPDLRRGLLEIYRDALILLQPLIAGDIASARIQRRPPCKGLKLSDLETLNEPLLKDVIGDAGKRVRFAAAFGGEGY